MSKLNFSNSWRFSSPGKLPYEALEGFFELICKIAVQGDAKGVYEHFKKYFANASGKIPNISSSIGWAQSDLKDYMRHASENAPLFIEAFYSGCQMLNAKYDFAVPDVDKINAILYAADTGFELCPPNIIALSLTSTISVDSHVKSLNEETLEIIQQSLAESEDLLSQGKNRPALQEILWLLESISTEFSGLRTNDGTVHGKYFNKIVQDLRRMQKGRTMECVLVWIETLYGYLSSPTGGGIRHGAFLTEGVGTSREDARLFCNLIRSYISYLLSMHERMSEN